MNHFHLKANRENHFFLRQFVSLKAIFLLLLCVFPCIGTLLPLFHTFSYWYASFIYFTLGLERQQWACRALISLLCVHFQVLLWYIISKSWMTMDNNQTLRLVCLICIFALYDQLGHIFCCQSVFLQFKRHYVTWCLMVKGNWSSRILFLFLNCNHCLCHLIQCPHMP